MYQLDRVGVKPIWKWRQIALLDRLITLKTRSPCNHLHQYNAKRPDVDRLSILLFTGPWPI